MEQAEIFEQIYRDYLNEVSRLDLAALRDRLGIEVDWDTAVVPFYGRPYRVSPESILDPEGRRPAHGVSVILCKYLLLCPETEPGGSEWVAYKDYKDAAPYAGGFMETAARPITQHFAGRISSLEEACQGLDGESAKADFSSDLAFRFNALPKVPVLMLFNDRDEEFPAHCSILFERRADQYLDVECLAMAGSSLAVRLKQEDK